MRSYAWLSVIVLLIIAMPMSAAAHHSRTEFTTGVHELERELVAIDSRNPHPTFELRTDASPGEVWHVQMFGSPGPRDAVGYRVHDYCARRKGSVGRRRQSRHALRAAVDAARDVSTREARAHRWWRHHHRQHRVLPMPTFSLKIGPSEAKAIRAAARAQGLSVSEYLRRAVLPRPKRASVARGSFEPGRVVIQGSSDAPMLTTADVAAALYD